MAERDSDISAGASPMPVVEVPGTSDLDALLKCSEQPFIVRGLVADWPLVQAGRSSGAEARAYVLQHARDVPFTASIGEPKAGGRLFYDDKMEMNFRIARLGLAEIFKGIDDVEAKEDAPAIYLASVDLHDFFTGLHEANHVDLGDRNCLASIWMGTRTRIAAHNDFPNNLACVAVGKRRFTLFPPDQFRNLYLGPVDNTPAGRAVSMVDFQSPDFDAHPRFREALRHAQVAELEPGDALYIPTMWWHHVEALSDFNVLINYWWRETPKWLGQPQDALTHAMLTVRDLPAGEKRIWRDLFDYYVFDNDDEVVAHIPPHGRSVLAPLTAESAGRIRAFLLRVLSR